MKVQDQQKKEVGYTAVKLIKDNMVVGLGTGSTVKFLLDALGKRVQKEGLNVVGVATSNRTRNYGEKLGIKFKSLDDVNSINLTIDGADEVDHQLNGIKGGGGALTWEKLVAVNSKDYVWIVDDSKVVNHLGKFPLPVEVLEYGHHQLFSRMKKLGYHPTLRKIGEKVFKTDEGNLIFDLHLNRINSPEILADKLSNMTGVVEHGLFLNMAKSVIVGGNNGVKTLDREEN